MKLTMRIVALLVLAVWLPATALCSVECSVTSADDICCPESSDEESRAPIKGNCVLSSALVKSDDDHSLNFGTMPILFVVTEVPAWPAFVDLECLPPIPPEQFAVIWHFLTRAALLPRAPSEVS